MQLTTNFHLDEFQCKSGTTMPDAVFKNIRALAFALQLIRDELRASITITSGYRSPEHNRTIGGAQNSMHMSGLAADFKVYGMDPKAVSAIIERLIREGKVPQGGLKAYKSWVHYDIRGERARW